MLLIVGMRKVANDNEPLTFELLAAPTARVTRRLMTETEKQKEPDADDKCGDREDENERYIAQRRKDLAAFERRANGGKN